MGGGPPGSVKVSIRNTRDVSSTFPRLFSKRFRRCWRDAFSPILNQFWRSSWSNFRSFSVSVQKWDCCNPLVRNLHSRGFRVNRSVTFPSSFSEPVSGRRFELLFFDFDYLWEPLWHLWPHHSRFFLRRCLRLIFNGFWIPGCTPNVSPWLSADTCGERRILNS